MRLEVLDDPAAAVADLLAGAAAPAATSCSPAAARRSARTSWRRRAARTGAGRPVWYSDERCVPRDHEWSNHAMAEAALLSHLDPRPEVMRMEGELGPERGADAYEALVRERLGDEPRWDLLLLGLGPDSHTASLFPGKPEVDVTDRLVVGVPEAGMEPQVPRISLTLPAINAARHVVFLVTGESKREAVRRAFGDDPDPTSPAAHVRPRRRSS